MAKKKEEEKEIVYPALELFVGVNFVPEDEKEETRIEPGVINLGVLPSAFEAELIELQRARVVNQ